MKNKKYSANNYLAIPNLFLVVTYLRVYTQQASYKKVFLNNTYFIIINNYYVLPVSLHFTSDVIHPPLSLYKYYGLVLFFRHDLL